MRILVTGGAGFIGSHLVEKLIDEGNTVAVYDNFTNFSDRPEYHKHALAFRKRMFKNQPSMIFRADILNKNSLRKAFERFKPQAVIHLAGLPLSRPPKRFEHLTIPINVHGSLNVLAEFENCPSAKKLIYTSSSMSYGHFLDARQKEDVILNPMNEYGASKAAVEYFVKLSKKDWVIVRPICVYGFTDCASRVTQLLIDAAISRKPAWIVKDEKLDFTYIDDVVEGYFQCINNALANRQTINISYGTPVPVTDYAKMVKGYFPNFTYDIKDPPQGQVNRGALDINKAKRLIGFQPKYDIEQGLSKTLALIRKYRWDKTVYR